MPRFHREWRLMPWLCLLIIPSSFAVKDLRRLPFRPAPG